MTALPGIFDQPDLLRSLEQEMRRQLVADLVGLGVFGKTRVAAAVTAGMAAKLAGVAVLGLLGGKIVAGAVLGFAGGEIAVRQRFRPFAGHGAQKGFLLGGPHVAGVGESQDHLAADVEIVAARM